MTPRNNRLHWILAICLAANSGCTSIRTSQLFRTSDGKFASYSASKGTKGVPCKLKVETGVRAHIRETYFIKKDSKEAVTTNGGRIYSIDLTPI